MPLPGDSLLFAAVGISGLIAGIFITLLFTPRRKSAKARNDPVERLEQVSKSEPLPAAPPPPQVKVHHPDEAHLWRDPVSGRVMAEVGGVKFSGPENLTSDQRYKLMQVLREGAGWFNNVPRPAPRVEAPAPVQPVPAPAPRQDPSATLYAEPRKTGPLPAEKAAEARKTAPFSIVTQIDAILQGLLEDSPLRSRGIRLVEDPGGGVTVWVGVKRYPSIDSVTDLEALSVIREAVAEWERLSQA